MGLKLSSEIWESAKAGVRAIGYEMAQMLQNPVFELLGCQRMSVNTLLCDALGLAEDC